MNKRDEFIARLRTLSRGLADELDGLWEPTEGGALDLLRRIADANVIFPSMCANNMEAWNLSEELKQYRSKPQPQRITTWGENDTDGEISPHSASAARYFAKAANPTAKRGYVVWGVWRRDPQGEAWLCECAGPEYAEQIANALNAADVSHERERNQCDGCARGLPLRANDLHYDDRFPEGSPVMACTKDRYRHIAPPANERDKYAERNPLGGPAAMFEAMADRIRSGEDYHAVLADYGLAQKIDWGGCSIQCANAGGCLHPEDCQSLSSTATLVQTMRDAAEDYRSSGLAEECAALITANVAPRTLSEFVHAAPEVREAIGEEVVRGAIARQANVAPQESAGTHRTDPAGPVSDPAGAAPNVSLTGDKPGVSPLGDRANVAPRDAALEFADGRISAGKFGEILGLQPGELHDFKNACRAFDETPSSTASSDLEQKLDAIAKALGYPEESWRMAGCDVLAHAVADTISNANRFLDELQKIDALLDELRAPVNGDWEGVNTKLSRRGRIKAIAVAPSAIRERNAVCKIHGVPLDSFGCKQCDPEWP